MNHQTTWGKRYIVFAGYDWCQDGGIHDAQDSFDTLSEALNAVEDNPYGWAHILDTETKDLIQFVQDDLAGDLKQGATVRGTG